MIKNVFKTKIYFIKVINADGIIFIIFLLILQLLLIVLVTSNYFKNLDNYNSLNMIQSTTRKTTKQSQLAAQSFKQQKRTDVLDRLYNMCGNLATNQPLVDCYLLKYLLESRQETVLKFLNEYRAPYYGRIKKKSQFQPFFYKVYYFNTSLIFYGFHQLFDKIKSVA